MSNSDLTELLASYVPRLIQNRVAQNPAPIDTPLAEDFLAVVMFADISGFTALTERLAEKGSAGVEKLARILNDYFGQLIDLVYECGGDVVKFGGDAVIAVWPIKVDPVLEQTTNQLDPILKDAQRQETLRVVECAFRVRERLLNYQAEGSTLYLKFSLGTGRVWESHIGGVFNRWEFVLVGEPLIEIGVANHLAQAGDIIASPSAWELIEEDCEAQTLDFELEPAGRIGVAARLRRIKTRAQSTESSEEALHFGDEAQVAFRPYIPGAIIHRISAGQSDWLAELRKVTILFINLPELGHNTSLEMAHETMRLIQQLVYRFEGSINKISQDDKGVMIDAAFGLPPLTHSDDPLRGIQSALVMRDELKAQGVRGAIGITTGRVFCGLIGTDQRREYTFLGHSVNLAGRLMSLALQQVETLEQDGIVILCDRPTYEAARERAEFQALPPQRMKGRSELVEVFRPLREKKGAIRAQTELIGRKEEKSLLVSAIQELQRGAAFQTIVLHGEAGIGKSRLMDELIIQAQTSQVRVFSGAADAVEKSNPYFAWRSVFNRLFDLEEITSKLQLNDADRLLIQNKVTDKLNTLDPELSRYAPLLNVILPISLPENELTSSMTSEVRGGNIRDLLVRLLQHEVDQSPILVTLEDLHWLDSASWALLWDVAQRVRPLLLAVNTRPFTPPVPRQFKDLEERTDTTFVQLDVMPLDEVEELVCQRLGVKSIPSQAGRLIREKSEGHPFFAEELAYALRDSGVLIIEGNECRLAPGLNDLNSLTLPDNLEAAITSRIDGLNPSQQLTLKVASVIGRLFAFRVLHAIHPIEADRSALDQYLDTLTRINLTLIESEAPDLAYLFKHAVTQEVAYNLMLFSQRRQLHQSVAEWIEQNYEKDAASQYTLLAHHWTRAAQDADSANRERTVGKAIEYLEKAGDQSLNNFANAEAIQFFTEALRFTDTNQVVLSTFKLGQWYRKLGQAYLGLGKLHEAKDHFLKAQAMLGEDVPASSAGMIGGLLGQLARQSRHRLWPKRYRGKQIDDEQEAIRLEIVQIYQQLATVLFLMGDPNPLPMFFSVVAGLNVAETIRDTPELSYMYAQMGAVMGFIPLRSQYEYYSEQWRQLDERFQHPGYFVSSAISLATLQSGIGDWDALRSRLERVIEICNEVGDKRQAGEAYSFLSSNAIIEGNIQEATERSNRMVEHALKANNPIHFVWGCQWLGSIAIHRGNYEEAFSLAARAKERTEKDSVGEVDNQTMDAIFAHALWLKGERRESVRISREICDKAVKASIVDYSIYIAYIHMTEVLFLDLERAWEEDAPAAEKEEVLKYAQQCTKIWKKYMPIFTVGAPAYYRFSGLIEYYQNKPEKAYNSWRTAIEKAHAFPMKFEEARAYLELGRHLPKENPERANTLEKARQLFVEVGLDNWVSVVDSGQSN